MIVNGISFNCECGACPTCDVIAREMDSKRLIHLACDDCFETVKASYNKISGLASFHESADGSISIGCFCPVCNVHTLHQTLPV